MIDYRELLRKYLEHVAGCEGIGFTYLLNETCSGSSVEFTDEEVAELQRMSSARGGASAKDAAARVYAAVDELNAAMQDLPVGCEVAWEALAIGTMSAPKQFMFELTVRQDIPRGSP